LLSVERARYEKILSPLADHTAFRAGVEAGRALLLERTVAELLTTGPPWRDVTLMTRPPPPSRLRKPTEGPVSSFGGKVAQRDLKLIGEPTHG
jgi:hypothetical protein